MGVVVGVTEPAKSEKGTTPRVETHESDANIFPANSWSTANAVIHMGRQKTRDDARLSQLTLPGSSLPRYRTSADERARELECISMLPRTYLQRSPSIELSIYNAQRLPCIPGCCFGSQRLLPQQTA
jgi:hypothetical protein